jgi:hypothetical protein
MVVGFTTTYAITTDVVSLNLDEGDVYNIMNPMYNCPIGSYVKVCLTVAEGSNNLERELHNKYTLVIWLNSAR